MSRLNIKEIRHYIEERRQIREVLGENSKDFC